MVSTKFNPDRDISSLEGKVIFITGGTAGLGSGSIATLAKHNPAHIFFSGRNQKSADALIKKVSKSSPDVKITFVRCDVSSFASIKSAVEDFTSVAERLDILMLNAGIMAVDPATSTDGYEIQFATNHLGHALLVKLLLPILKDTAKEPNSDVRIVNMTSVAYKQAPKQGIDFGTLKSSQEKLGITLLGPKWARYGQSKLAQMLYSQELAKHNPELTSVSVHPGVILTGLFENISFATRLPILLGTIGQRTPVDEGHWNQCWAATVEKTQLKSGEYYEPIGQVGKRGTKAARDEKLAEKLYSWTQEQLADYN